MDSIFQIIAGCGVISVVFCLVGFAALWLAVRKARPEFREKGFLRTPSGKRWFRFLLWKQYDAFDQPSTRFFFGVTHFCMLGIFIALGAVVVLVGSALVLRGVQGLPPGGMIK